MLRDSSIPTAVLLGDPQPVQLTFDRLAGGFGRLFSADPARVMGRWPRVNPLVFHGVQGEDSSLLLDAMAAECVRLEPDAKVVLADGAALRGARGADGVAALGAPNLLLLHDLDNLPASARRALQRLLRQRIEDGLLTVLSLRLVPGQELQRFCARTCAWGLAFQIMPPGSGSRREICLAILHVRGARVDQTTHSTTSNVPWQCAADVRALGERVLHAAYSWGTPLGPDDVTMLGGFLGRRPSEATASEPRRCCLNRLHLTMPRGLWPPDYDGLAPPEKTVTAEFHHRCATVDLRQRTWQHRFRLEMRSDHEGRVPARFELDIVLRPRFSVRLRDVGPWTSQTWGLTAGLTRMPGDPFSEACNWLYRALTPLRPRDKQRRPSPDLELSQTMREVRARLHEAACAAVALLDTSARKVALRFSTHMRPWLYGRLAADVSGRLAQVAQACPGALTFAYALRAFGRRPGCGRASGRLLRGLIAGQPLNPLLDEAIAAWAAGAQRKVENPRIPEGHRRVWRCLAEGEGGKRESLLRAQRLLIRRAGAGVPSMTLWLPPPPTFAPEDIPDRKLDNARWFRVVKCLRPLLTLRGGITPERRHNLCMFVSRHALQLHKCAELGNSDYWRTSALLDYARAMNDWPRRATSPTRCLPAAETWHHHFEEIRQLAQLAAETGEKLVDPDGNPLPFPEPPCPGWRSGGDEIVLLRTAEEVLAEGRRMHNCVASRVAEALTGRAILYHGEILGKPLTIQIAPEGDGYRLHETAGLVNAKPTAGQMRVLGQFIEHLRVAKGCVCSKNALAESDTSADRG